MPPAATAGGTEVTLLPILVVLTLLTGAVVATLAGLWRAVAAQVVAVVTMAIGLVLAVTGLVVTLREGPLRHDIGGWPPPVGIEYVLDPLSGFITSVVAFIGLLVAIYPVRAGFDTGPRRGSPLYGLVLLLLTGLVGVITSGDLFHLFVMLEIYAIATYALVAMGGDRGLYASFRYLLIGTAGSGLYLLGVGFIYFSTGSLNMVDVAGLLPELADSPTIAGALALIVTGLAVKMALFPFHVWLPDAHSYAPPGVAALLAAVQVKAAAYALIRILFDVFGVEYVTDLHVTTLLAYFGAAGVVVGSVMAVRVKDIKRLLAYSTVAQLGFIGMGIGMASPLALIGAMFHVLNHAVMKSCLFLVAGGVLDQTGIKEIARYAGMWRRMPWTMAGFGVAALAMIGIPPTAGFFSKWYLFLGSLETRQWLLTVVIIGSTLLTLAYFLRLFEQIFTQEPAEEAVEQAHEPEGRVVGPVMVLAGALLLFGVGNAVVITQVLDPIAQRLLG
jgi:multicomponent Na+:H+ antiporter subunit D